MLGKGLITGLQITLKKLFEKKITEKYPEVPPTLPIRSHGSFAFSPEKCLACSLCANACPNGVIKVVSVQEPKKKRTLQDFKMSLGYCLFCGLCVEACPTKALQTNTHFELSCYTRSGTVHMWSKKTLNEQQTESDSIQPTAHTEVG